MTRWTPPVRALAALALAAAVAGCDAQADRGYPGEVLLTLHGQVTGTPPLPPLESAMLWQRGPPPSTDDQELAIRAPVESGFPASFTIRLYQPPPSAARRTLAPGEVSFARANVAAVPYGIAEAYVAALPTADGLPYSMDVDHWVIHLQGDVRPGSLMEWWLQGSLPAGYSLVRFTAVDPACIDLDACVADLVARGVPDDGTENPGTARGFCRAPYRLSPASPDELLLLTLGTHVPTTEGSCP